jgi:hypothetical protein
MCCQLLTAPPAATLLVLPASDRSPALHVLPAADRSPLLPPLCFSQAEVEAYFVGLGAFIPIYHR